MNRWSGASVERVIQLVAGQLQMSQRPRRREQSRQGPPAPPPRREREQIGGSVHADPAAQGERGAGDRAAAARRGDVVHPFPVDRLAAGVGLAHDHREVGDPDQAHESMVGLTRVGGQDDELLGGREPVRGRAGAVDGPAAAPEGFGVERGDALGRSLQGVVQLQEEGRNVAMGERGVVAVRPRRPGHLPAGLFQRSERPAMVRLRQQQVDVLHRAQSRFRIARRDHRALENDRFQPGAGEGFDGQGDRPGQKQQRLHPVGIGRPTEHGPKGTQHVERVGRTEGAPEQGADAVLRGGRDGEVEVRTAVEGTPDGGRVRLVAAGLPEQCRRLLDDRVPGPLGLHALIVAPRGSGQREIPARSRRPGSYRHEKGASAPTPGCWHVGYPRCGTGTRRGRRSTWFSKRVRRRR